MPATAMPMSAHTIHEGKYEPKIFLDGAPLQAPRLMSAASRAPRVAQVRHRLPPPCIMAPPRAVGNILMKCLDELDSKQV
jgi:hypothetical protein